MKLKKNFQEDEKKVVAADEWAVKEPVKDVLAERQNQKTPGLKYVLTQTTAEGTLWHRMDGYIWAQPRTASFYSRDAQKHALGDIWSERKWTQDWL